VDDGVVLGELRVVIRKPGQAWISFRPRRLAERNGLQTFVQGDPRGKRPSFVGFAEIRTAHRILDIDEHVVFDAVVAPAVDQNALGDIEKDVALNHGFADSIVEINAGDAMRAVLVTAKFAQQVVTDDRTARGPRASCINGGRVVGFADNVVQMIAFDDVIVSRKQNRGMRGGVDLVVGRAQTNAAEPDPGLVGLDDSAVVVDQVVDRLVIGRR
jgi:hypothetical protein